RQRKYLQAGSLSHVQLSSGLEAFYQYIQTSKINKRKVRQEQHDYKIYNLAHLVLAIGFARECQWYRSLFSISCRTIPRAYICHIGIFTKVLDPS
ncbi:hypothetical protein T310_10112, partial [Rasamsonia emersonii CBS 393.64]